MSNEELAREIQAGATDRMADLWEQVEGLCCWKAKQVVAALQLRGNPCGVEFDDLYQTGYLAMVAAVESYQPESGAFSTWFMFRLKTAFAEATGYRTKCGRCEPLNTATSLDRPIQPDEPDGGSLAEFVSDGKAEAAIAGVEQSVYHKQLHEAMEAAIDELPPENALALRLRYWGNMTLAAAGKAMERSPERIRQMENKGIRELRKSKVLYNFLDFDMYHGTGLGTFRSSGSSIQERYVMKQERREEYERRWQNEQVFEVEMGAIAQRAIARIASMSPEEKARLLAEHGIVCAY